MEFTFIDAKGKTHTPPKPVYTQELAKAFAEKLAAKIKSKVRVLMTREIHATSDMVDDFPF